jgi:hypothetical protein
MGGAGVPDAGVAPDAASTDAVPTTKRPVPRPRLTTR